jgi:hypothetical protein
MNLIGINGFKRSGKGETYNAVSRIAGDRVVYGIGFADKLKIVGALALGYKGHPRELIDLMDAFKEHGQIDAYVFDDEDDHEQTISGRQYLQFLGNEARNVFGENFWIDQVLPYPVTSADRLSNAANIINEDALQQRYPDVDIVCLTDLRYPNEAARVKALGGVVWEVVRPGLTSDGHASEQPLPEALIDYVIVNDGSLADLDGKVAEAMKATLS